MKDCTNIYPAWLQIVVYNVPESIAFERVNGSVWNATLVTVIIVGGCGFLQKNHSVLVWNAKRSLHFNILTDFVEENVFARTGWNQYICATNKIKQNRYLDGEWDNVVIFIPRRNECVSVLPVIFHRQASRISVPKWLHNWFKCTGLCPHFD